MATWPPGLTNRARSFRYRVVRAVVEKRVDRHDRVEELRGERQRPRVAVDREDAVLDARVPDPP
jgi:hypothetical protein